MTTTEAIELPFHAPVPFGHDVLVVFARSDRVDVVEPKTRLFVELLPPASPFR